MNSLIWSFVEIWLGYWYCGRSLKFARALRFDSKLGRGAITLLSLLWPLAMFLVLAVRVDTGSRGPLFLTPYQEKRLRNRLRDGERDDSRREAERTWNEWNQRLTFITKLTAEAERENDWLAQERLAEQLEFLAATEPMRPDGVKESRASRDPAPRPIKLDAPNLPEPQAMAYPAANLSIDLSALDRKTTIVSQRRLKRAAGERSFLYGECPRCSGITTGTEMCSICGWDL